MRSSDWVLIHGSHYCCERNTLCNWFWSQNTEQMRRFHRPLGNLIASPTAITPLQPPLNAMRNYSGPWDVGRCFIMMGLCVWCWGAWFNSAANVYKFGLWRFKNYFEEPILAADFRLARLTGSFFGFLFYWYLCGPMKYRHSDLEQWQPRFGPF